MMILICNCCIARDENTYQPNSKDNQAFIIIQPRQSLTED